MARSRACSRFILLVIGTHLAAQVPTILNVPNPVACSGEPRYSCELSGFAFSDPVALKTIGKRWEGPFTPRGGDQAFLASINAAVSLRKDSWRMQIWHQQRVLMTSNRDTAELLRTTKAREDLPVGRTYDLKMIVEGISRTGITLSRSWVVAETDTFAWSVGAVHACLQGVSP